MSRGIRKWQGDIINGVLIVNAGAYPTDPLPPDCVEREVKVTVVEDVQRVLNELRQQPELHSLYRMALRHVENELGLDRESDAR